MSDPTSASPAPDSTAPDPNFPGQTAPGQTTPDFETAAQSTSTYTAPDQTAPYPAAPTPSVAALPRVRWAAIIWGLVFMAIAAGALLVGFDGTTREGVATWLAGLDGRGWGLVALIAVGALAVILGLAGALRGATGRAARRAGTLDRR